MILIDSEGVVLFDRYGKRRWVKHLSDFEVRFLVGRAEKTVERDGDEDDREMLSYLKRELSYRA